MSEIIFQVEEDAVDDGYVATALGYGITTQAESIVELKEMILDAVRCHFDSPKDRTGVIRLHFVREDAACRERTDRGNRRWTQMNAD